MSRPIASPHRSLLHAACFTNPVTIEVIALLLACGLAAGLLAGLLGIGGGLVVVPVVTWLLLAEGASQDLAVPMAVATSLASMLLTSASAIFSHHRLGGMDAAAIGRLAPTVAAGAVLGAWIALAIPGATLARVFAAVAAIIGLRMLLAVRPAVADRPAFPRGWWSLGPVIGAISALVGIGGGSFNVPYLARNGYTMARAVAIASACGYPIALAGAVSFVLLGWGRTDWPATLGWVWWPGMVLIGMGGMVAAPWGARLAHRLPAGVLRRTFGVFLILVALRMAW